MDTRPAMRRVMKVLECMSNVLKRNIMWAFEISSYYLCQRMNAKSREMCLTEGLRCNAAGMME